MHRESFLNGYASAILEKIAFAVAPAWGGQSWVTKRKAGLRGEAGYDYLLGTVPVPSIGASIGTDNFNVGFSGPIPGISFGDGVPKDYSGRVEHLPRSLWKIIADEAKQRQRH
jgi:hypothetical protein